MALAWLVNDPTLDIRAILVAGTGLADCATGVANLRALLVALDATGPEVGCGAETAARRRHALPGRAASRCRRTCTGSGCRPPDADAPWRTAEKILGDLLDAASDPLAILSTGPPDHARAASSRDPDRAVRVASVTAIAGCHRRAG